jgi:hypothetical protein
MPLLPWWPPKSGERRGCAMVFSRGVAAPSFVFPGIAEKATAGYISRQ